MSVSLRDRATRARVEQELHDEEVAKQRAFDAKLEKHLAPITAERNQILRDNTRKIQNYWKRPISELSKDYQVKFFIPDVSLTLDQTVKPEPNKGTETFAQFLSLLTPNTGYLLSEQGKMRVQSFGISQAVTMNADLTRIRTWRKCFDRLLELNCFNDGELGLDESAKTVRPRQAQPEPVPSFDQVLDAHNTNDRGENEIVKFFAMRENQQECLVWFNAFRDSVLQNFNHSFTEGEVNAIVEYMRRFDLNFLQAKSWDRARVALVKAGSLPENLLYPDEVLGQAIEDSDVSLTDYRARQEFARRSRLIGGQR